MPPTLVKKAKKPIHRPAPPPPQPGSQSDSDNESIVSATDGNLGWADSISKVLKSTKPEYQNKTILARAKKSIAAVKSKKNAVKPKDFGFEIAGADQEVEEAEKESAQSSSQPEEVAKKQRRKNMPLQLRKKPQSDDYERERVLRKIATRGVVQFFNAVRMQQKDLEHQLVEAGPLDSRKDAVLNNINKKKFLDVLMSGKRAKSTDVDREINDDEDDDDDDGDDDDDEEDNENAPSASKKKKSEWNVLRDDFMTNKKNKHWDEEDDDNSEKSNNTDDNDNDNDNDDDDD